MQVNIKHKVNIPISRVAENINANIVTFGVHSDKDSQHPKRDALQHTPLYSALYGETTTIGNAALLKKSTEGFIFDTFINGQLEQRVAPPRPVLQPITEMMLKSKKLPKLISLGIHNQFASPYVDVFSSTCLEPIARTLGERQVLQFLKGRGMGYWDDDAMYNGPYTAIVKFLAQNDKYNLNALIEVYDDVKKQINSISKWNADFNAVEQTYPLLDSLDLIKSIDARVEKK